MAKKAAIVALCLLLIAVSAHFALPRRRVPTTIDADDYRRPWVCEACGHTFLEPPTAGVRVCPECGQKKAVHSIIYVCAKCGHEFEACRYKHYYGSDEEFDEDGKPVMPTGYYKDIGGTWTPNRKALRPVKCPECGNADPATLAEKLFVPGAAR